MIWTCDKCGGENVLQEWSILTSMNSNEVLEEEITNLQPGNFYWCPDCEEDCNPIDSHINSLHPDYEPE